MPGLSRIIVEAFDHDALELPTATALVRAIAANRSAAESLIAGGWGEDHVAVRLAQLAADQAEEVLWGEASSQTIAAARLAAAGELPAA